MTTKSRAATTVTIIIPSYNAAAWLADAIESIAGQTTPARVEALVVDDGSTDETAVIAGRYGSAVRYVRQENRGRSAARNHGLRLAQSDYVGFLDADDRFAANKIDRQLDFLDGHPACVGVLTSLRLFDDRSTQLDPGDNWSSDRVSALGPLDFLTRDVGHPASILIRRDAAPPDLHFPEDMSWCEDRVFLALLRAAGGVGYLNEPLYDYRQQERPDLDSADFRRGRFEVVQHWLHEHARELNVTTADGLDSACRMLADETLVAYYRRNLRYVARDRDALRQLWPAGVQQHALYRVHLWPAWLLRIKDLFDRMRNAAK